MRLWPFSCSEVERGRGAFVDHLFTEGPSLDHAAAIDRLELAERIAAGGFPPAMARTLRGRRRFFESYVESIIGRDVPEVSRPRDTAAVGRLLRLLAARSATLLSRERLARDLGIDRKTVEHHLRILEDLMLVRIHPPWHRDLGRREVKTPKVYVTDTGMLAALSGLSSSRIAGDADVGGRALETFAVMELVKLASWSEAGPRLFHYRDREGREVDVVLEHPDGSIVGIEVKASATVTPGDFRSLGYLRDRLGDRFVRGVVLYLGARALPFGDRLSALPLSSLCL